MNGQSTIGGYINLVKAAYPAIKRGNRNSIVIAGVGGPRSSTGNGNVSARVWMNKLVGTPKQREVRRLLAAHLPVARTAVQHAVL